MPNLIVPEITDVQFCDEFVSIQLWAHADMMVINKDKTEEIFSLAPTFVTAFCFMSVWH
jgi:hypothetical protein